MKRGLYHIQQRKRGKTDNFFHSYPSKIKYVSLLDRMVLLLALIAPFFEIPQLIEIYSNKAAENVSLITWGFFSLMAIPWFFYGIIHKQKPIIILYFLWFLIDTTIVIGILMYS